MSQKMTVHYPRIFSQCILGAAPEGLNALTVEKKILTSTFKIFLPIINARRPFKLQKIHALNVHFSQVYIPSQENM